MDRHGKHPEAGQRRRSCCLAAWLLLWALAAAWLFSNACAAAENTATAPQVEAERALARGRCEEAVRLFQMALETEKDPELRAFLAAKMVRCRQNLGDIRRAGDAFLRLLADNPQTPCFEAMPLAWTVRQNDADVDAAAQQWLARREPAAMLLGASYLLAGPRRAQAREKLSELTRSNDPLIQTLSAAQLWRITAATATEDQLDAWQKKIESLPEALQSGPYYPLGLGRLQRKQWEKSAQAFLRTAILGCDDRRLAAQATIDAGVALEAMQQPEDAQRLYREVLAAYPDDERAATEAGDRLVRLGSRNTAPVPVPTLETLFPPPHTAYQRFLAGLAARQLGQLAQRDCQTALQRKGLSLSRRAELCAALMDLLTIQAQAELPAGRESLWRRLETCDQHSAGELATSPWRVFVAWSSARAGLVRAVLELEETQPFGASPAESIERLRTAAQQFERLGASIRDVLAEVNRGAADASNPRPQDLSELLRLAALEQVVAMAALEGCQSDAAQRAAIHGEAQQLLAPLLGVNPADPLYWPSRFEEVSLAVQCGDAAAASAAIESMRNDNPPAEAALRLRGASIQIALAGNRLHEALNMVYQGRKLDGQSSAELDSQWLATYLAAWRLAVHAQDAAKVAEWRGKIEGMLTEIAQVYRPGAMRKAELAVAAAVAAAPAGADPAMDLLGAQCAYRAGAMDAAIAGFDRAQSAATARGDAEKAFALGQTAAAMERQRGNHKAAMDRYLALAKTAPKPELAAEAHALAVQHAGELAKSGGAEALDNYAAVLKEHVRRWGKDPAASGVRLRLGKLLEFQRDWQGAVEAFRGIDPAAGEFLAALRAIERCTWARIGQCRAAGEPAEPIAAEAAQWFADTAASAAQRKADCGGPIEQAASLAAAQMWTRGEAAHFDRAEAILAAAMEHASDAPAEWRSAARTMLVCAMAGCGRRKEAAKLLESAAEESSSSLIDALDGLRQISAAAKPEVRAELAAMRLRIIEQIEKQPQKLADDAQRALDREKAEALAESGRADESLAIWQALADAAPRDFVIQEGYARQLAAKGDRASLHAALQQWLAMQKNWPDGSRRWFQTQLSIAALELQLDSKAKAAQRLRLLESLYPEMGGEEFKAQFLDLRKQCGK